MSSAIKTKGREFIPQQGALIVEFIYLGVCYLLQIKIIMKKFTLLLLFPHSPVAAHRKPAPSQKCSKTRAQPLPEPPAFYKHKSIALSSWDNQTIIYTPGHTSCTNSVFYHTDESMVPLPDAVPSLQTNHKLHRIPLLTQRPPNES